MNMERAGKFCALLFAAANVFAAELYVAPYGSNTASGTWADPFKTIQQAVDSAGAGHAIYVMEGTYHEEVVVDGLAGTSNAPVTIAAYQDDRVVMDGTKSLAELGSVGWTLHSGNIYKTTLTQDVWQVMADAEMMIPARWPNGFLQDDTIYDRNVSWSEWDAGSVNGAAVDTDLDAAGIDATGAIGIFNSGSWKTWARVITNHNPTTGALEFEPLTSFGSKDYYLEGSLELLDAEREWFFDSATKELYLWAVGGGVPTGDIRGKVQSYAFNVTASSHVVLDGIDFFGTTFSFYDSPNSTVQNCDLLYPSCSQRMLGVVGRPPTSSMKMPSKGNAAHYTLFNCSFQYADSDAIHMKGAGCTLDNNEFRYIDFSCANLPGLMVTITVDGDDADILRNTVEKTGASAMFKIGKGTVQYNRITDTGHLQHDGSMTQYTVKEANGSVVAYNWYHDGKKSGARFDSPNPPTQWGTNGTMRFNVCMNTGTGLLPKGNAHFIYGNTTLDCNGQGIAIHNYADGSGASNDLTITRNNASEKLSGKKGNSGYVPLPGPNSHNWNGYLTGLDLRTQLRDPDNWDFRPKPGSDLVDAGIVVPGITDSYVGAAPDIGAYESGASNYWMAGRKLEGASSPVPPDGATGVKSDAHLMWLQALEGASYKVYFGTNGSALVSQGSQTNNVFDPGALATNINYHWRVDAVTPDGVVTGEVWSFNLGNPPHFISDPLEKTAAAFGQTYAESLAGDVEDPDGDTVVFSKMSGSAWLTVAPDGTLGGTPGLSDLGWNSFTVLADDQDEGATEGTVRIEVNAGSFLGDSTVVFHADFQGSETTNLLPLSQAERNAVLGEGWSDLGAMPELLYEVAEDEAGNKVLVFAIEKSSSTTVPVVDGGFGSVVDFSSNTTLVVDWEWMHTDKSGGGNGYAFFELLDTNDVAIASVKWKDNGQIELDGTEVASIIRQLPVDEVGFGGLTSANWNPLPMQLIMTGGSIELSVNGAVVSRQDGVYTHATGIRLKCLSNETWSDGGMWIDNIRAESGIPSAETYYAKWGSDHDLAGAAGYHDNPDGDAFDNLAEYALGGAPDVFDNSPLPTFLPAGALAEEGENLNYVYRRRIDREARGLDYLLELNTNLITGVWSTNGYAESGTLALEAGFEAVTNQISAEEPHRFIRLRISVE